MMFLALDSGNSLMKATFLDTSGEVPQLVEQLRLDRFAIAQLPVMMASRGVDSAMICASGASDPELLTMLSRTPNCEVRMLDHNTPLPIGIDYATPHTLGLDRIAAAAGAAFIAPGCGALVVDAGTAITIDVVTASGTFRGGNISPGIVLRLGSLHRSTAALPEVDPMGSTPEFGFDTVTAMRSGALRGACAEISDSFRRARKDYGVQKLLITGGDALSILPLLRNDYITDADSLQHVAHLLPLGLLSIFNTSK